MDGLSSLLFNCKEDRSGNQKKINSLQNELSHLHQLHSSHREEIQTTRKTLIKIAAQREESISSDLESRLQGFILSADILSKHFNGLSVKVVGYSRLKDNLDAQRVSMDRELTRAENKIMKSDMKRKFLCVFEDASEVTHAAKAESKEFCHKKNGLETQIADLKVSLENEAQRLWKEAADFLDEATKLYELNNNHLEEQKAFKCDIENKQSNIDSEIKSLNDLFEEKTILLDKNERMHKEQINELECSEYQNDADLQTSLASLEDAEEFALSLKEEEDSLIQTKDDLSIENQTLNNVVLDCETRVQGLEERVLVLENSQTDLLKTLETLKQELEDLSKQKHIGETVLQNSREDLKSILEEIQQKTVILGEEVPNKELRLKDEEAKILKLESDLRSSCELEVELERETSVVLSLRSQNHDFQDKCNNFTLKESEIVQNTEQSNQKLQSLSDKLKKVHEAWMDEIERLTTDFENVEAALDDTVNQLEQFRDKNGSLVETLSDNQLEIEMAESEGEELIAKLKLKSEEEIKVAEEGTAKLKTDVEEAKKKFGAVCKGLLVKTKEKNMATRTTRVQLENLAEKNDRLQKMDSKLQELLAKSLKANSEAAQGYVLSKRVTFSEKLEKHSPLSIEGFESKDVKPILKRRPTVYSDNSVKKTKYESSTNDPYYPSFE